MLRTYKPITNHTIFKYQTYVQHLVCEVWCNASIEHLCQDLLLDDFKTMYLAREWVKIAVDEIYELCKPLSIKDRDSIRHAFVINNDIESLCEGIHPPIELNTLPQLVEQKMKPLLVKFYSDLISAKDKLDYYNKLIENNQNYKFCPCCGLTLIESTESPYREDNDHYLPKAEYPFASVNFNNLPPLCSKCNKKCKSTKNPFKDGRKSFYAFKSLDSEFEITISISDQPETNYLKFKENEISIAFNNDPDKVDTWDWLFEIKSRYNEEIRQFSNTELRVIKNKFNRYKKFGLTYEQVINDAIDDYKIDSYDDRKFLRAPFLKEMINKSEWMSVYIQ